MGGPKLVRRTIIPGGQRAIPVLAPLNATFDLRRAATGMEGLLAGVTRPPSLRMPLPRRNRSRMREGCRTSIGYSSLVFACQHGLMDGFEHVRQSQDAHDSVIPGDQKRLVVP